MGDSDTKSLILLESLIQLIKKDKNVACILQQTVAITKSSTAPQKNVVCEVLSDVLENLKLCKTQEELDDFQVQLKSLFLPKALRQVAVDKSSYTLKITTGMMAGLPLPLPVTLGQGSCGMVMMGTLTKGYSQTDVAIKRAHFLGPDMQKLTINEAQAMVNLKQHANIVSILGYEKVTGDILMEHMALGDLQRAMTQITFTKANLMDFIVEIAKGMEFIDNKKYVHRSLKTTNVLLNAKKQVKIGDFGFAQYVGNTDGVFTDNVQRSGFHVAPESFKTNKYRIQSDVYSMGLLIWELFFELKRDERHLQFISFLQQTHEPAGAKLPRPPKCPHVIYNYVRDACLNPKFNARPTFADIQKKVRQVLLDNQMD